MVSFVRVCDVIDKLKVGQMVTVQDYRDDKIVTGEI